MKCLYFSEYYSSKGSFRDTDLCAYALGEMVITQYSVDKKWYRAKVTDTDPDNFKVEVYNLKSFEYFVDASTL